MKLDRVPAKILMALGLVTAPNVGGGCVSACLDVGPASETSYVPATGTGDATVGTGPGATSTTAATSSASTGGATSSTSTGGSDVGESSVGPCLSPPSDGSTTAGSDTAGSSTGPGGSSTGGMAAPPDDPTARVLQSGVLPPDVAARLRGD